MERKTAMMMTIAAGMLAACGIANAQIAFGPGVTLAAGPQPGGAATGDFDGDGDIDFAVTVGSPDRVITFLSDGSGNFVMGAAAFLGNNTGAGDMQAADFDNDGDIDLAIAFQNQGSIALLLNSGGVFTLAGTTPVGSNPRGLNQGDYNNDGLVDLAVANRDSNTASVLTNTGGAFTSTSFGVGVDPRAAAFIDFNNDGLSDLAVSNNDDTTISLLSNTGAGFAPAGNLTLFDGPEGLVAGDFDNDGDEDLAASSGAAVTVFLNNGGLSFGTPYFTGGVGDAGSIVAADFDCDGDMDLAVANDDTFTVSLLANSGAGAFAAGVTLPADNRPEQLAMGDFDGNGSSDLVVPIRNTGNVIYWLNANACEGGDPTGACCIGTDCLVLTAADCAAMSGTYQGDGAACGPKTCSAQNPCPGDIDGDGDVDADDLSILLNAFGQGCQ